MFGVHAVGGLIGALLTGVLASEKIGGAEPSLGAQALASLSVLVYSGVVTALILLLVQRVVGLRVTAADEAEGLDLSQHGERLE